MPGTYESAPCLQELIVPVGLGVSALAWLYEFSTQGSADVRQGPNTISGRNIQHWSYLCVRFEKGQEGRAASECA